MISIISWLVTGLIVGAVARLLTPGRQDLGFFKTSLLGILGAFVGGGISWSIWGLPGEPFSNHAWPGYVLAILGSILVLFLAGRRGHRAVSDPSY